MLWDILKLEYLVMETQTFQSERLLGESNGRGLVGAPARVLELASVHSLLDCIGSCVGTLQRKRLNWKID